MAGYRFFIDRRKGSDRRIDRDPCKYMPLDLYHRKRRKSKERRASERTLEEDLEAFLGSTPNSVPKDPNNSH
jgi:hypothetical protein